VSTTHNYRQKNSAVFAQDDWKATQNLTLNLGLRTEFFGAWSDKRLPHRQHGIGPH